MNTTSLGDSLEARIFDLLQSEIEADRFWAKRENCKVFRRKGYYSRDRRDQIIFDVAVEIYLPKATEYSALVLIECKHYSHPVPVDDAEEFFAKIQQVSGANVKAVIASTASFQSGTRAYAKSKGMGLMRYFDSTHFKWELRRSPSATARATDPDSAYIVDDGLSKDDFQSTIFDLFLQSPVRATNSLWEFIEDIALDTTLTPSQIRKIANRRGRYGDQVPFLEKADIEALATEILSEVDYELGEVRLDAICDLEKNRSDLKVFLDVPLPTGMANAVLGRILFGPNVIHVFSQATPHRGRERFTLAHELAHHILKHDRYMFREYCDEGDFALDRADPGGLTAVSRMEFQANYFASCLLMPRANFIEDFRRQIRVRGIPDRGFGALYIDDQPCNLDNYDFVTNVLMRAYGVSRTAATLRLDALGLIRDARRGFRPIFAHGLPAWLMSDQGTEPEDRSE